MKDVTRGSNAWWLWLGILKTWGNDAKFFLFIFFCKVALMGPSKFKNRACLIERRAERGGGGERKSLEESSVVGERNLRLARLLFIPPFFSPSATHEARYAPARSLSRNKSDAGPHTAAEEPPRSQHEKNQCREIKEGLRKDQRGFESDR